MSEHAAELYWKRETDDFTYQSYDRNHIWKFENGVELEASAAPQYKGDPNKVDPESAFAAALSSCHMLTFLALAAMKKFVVDSYHDRAVATLDKDSSGNMAITRVTLTPRIEFSGDNQPSAEELQELHDQAHHKCFLANSVKCEVTVNC
ncbi:MAG: OsmC family peroxiredoxin [Candidatus Dadabacteria bacterium]|nr:MAG: OsmC family peroxiredoxin [Candidatus Dadabacteria bacterium]